MNQLQVMDSFDNGRRSEAFDKYTSELASKLKSELASQTKVANALYAEATFTSNWLRQISQLHDKPHPFGGETLATQLLSFNGVLHYEESDEWLLKSLETRANNKEAISLLDNYYWEMVDPDGSISDNISVPDTSEAEFMLSSTWYVLLTRDLVPEINSLINELQEEITALHFIRRELSEESAQAESLLSLRSERHIPITYLELEARVRNGGNSDFMFPELKNETLSAILEELKGLVPTVDRQDVMQLERERVTLEENLVKNEPPNFSITSFGSMLAQFSAFASDASKLDSKLKIQSQDL